MTVKDKQVFENFLLAEYEHIANAHFNALETISEFFKHYVTMIGLPLAVLPVLIKFFPEPAKAIVVGLKGYELLVVIASAVVASIGFAMMLYIISLYKLSLLYANTVNGVRNYFYEIAELSRADEARIRVLPRVVNQLPISADFIPTVITFALLNGAYPAAAFVLLSIERGSFADGCTALLVVAILGASIIIHVLVYLYKRASK